MDFHTTSWTAVLEAADSQGTSADAALEELLRAYWRPLYLFARIRGRSHHDAEDAVQAFFAGFVERRTVKRADRARGRFRSFLQVAFQNFLLSEMDRAKAQKRGGGAHALSLDDLAAAGLQESLAAAPADPITAFDREWAGVLLERATERLRLELVERGDGATFAVLHRFLGREGSAAGYEEAAAVGTTPANVKVRVHRLRVEFRRHLRVEVAATVTDAHEIEAELLHLRQALTA